MRVKKNSSYYIFTLIFTMALNISCDKDSPTSTESTTIVGSWTRIQEGVTMTIIFKSDSKCEVDFDDDPEIDVWGSYSISGNQITFNDEGGAASDIPGVYNYNISGNKMTFTLVDDESEGRKSVILGTWTKK